MTHQVARLRRVYLLVGICLIALGLLAADFAVFAINHIQCWSSEYGSEFFLAGCNEGSRSALQYDAGAVYYGLEPGISQAVSQAQVIVLGTSRAQAAFSTKATESYFSKQNIAYFLLGFGSGNDSEFALPTFKRRRAAPKLVVVNADHFFDPSMGPSAKDALSGGWRTYWELASMAALQRLQRLICPRFASICAPPWRTIYRSAKTGRWHWLGSYFPEQSIAVTGLPQNEFRADEMSTAIDLGEKFLREINVDRQCVVLTGVPNNDSDAPAIASFLADRLGTRLILPDVDNLMLLDDFHLNFESTERWSAAFLTELTPMLQHCVRRRQGG